MGLIRDEDRVARADYVEEEQRRRDQQSKDALAELERRLPEILEQIASDARERLRTTGEARVAVAHLPSSLWPVTGDPAATKLVEDALRENEPHTASVEFEQNTRLIDPAGRITLVARFDPPLS